MATKICFINQKGGCGKSSTCFHLAGTFAAAGNSVLAVDADPQGSLSQGFFGSAAIEELLPESTLATLFDESSFPQLSHLATPTRFNGLSVIRANQSLGRHNIPAPELSGLKQFALRTFLEGDVDPDLVLIDCPPNLYQCSWNALLAADFVVIPVPPEDFATQGLRTIHQAIANARKLNPTLQLLGHLVTRADRRLLLHRAYENKLRALYGEDVLATTVPEASAYKAALSRRMPVCFHEPSSRASVLTQDLANELLMRIGLMTAQEVAL